MSSKEEITLDEKLAEIILLNTDKDGQVSRDIVDVLKENNITLSQVFDRMIHYASQRIGADNMKENLLACPEYHELLKALKEKVEPEVYNHFLAKLKLTPKSLY